MGDREVGPKGKILGLYKSGSVTTFAFSPRFHG